MIGEDHNVGHASWRERLFARLRARTGCLCVLKTALTRGGILAQRRRGAEECRQQVTGRNGQLKCGAWHLTPGKCLMGMLLLASCAGAQETAVAKGGIRGTIYDADFNIPVPAVRVSVPEVNRATNTVDDGHYAFADLPPGIYTVMFAKEGFQRETRINVLVTPGAFAEVDTRLFGEYTDMDELVVSDIDLGGASDVGLLNLRAQSVVMMDTVGSEMMSRAGAGTAAAALKLVTGASVQDGKYAVIRGLSDRYTSSMLNGVRLPTADKDRRAVQMDQFPSAMIESIQITKNFMPDLQGDASGGGINIITKSVPDKLVLSASVSVEYDTEATGNGDFLTYKGGGNKLGGMRGMLDPIFWQHDDLTGPRGLEDSYSMQLERMAPGPNYGTKLAAGNMWNLAEGVTAGVLLSGSYGQKYKYRESEKLGIKDPDTVSSHTETDDDKFAQVYTSTDEQLWSTSLTMGIQSECNEIKLTGLYTHLARDIVDLRYGEYTPELYRSRTNGYQGQIFGYDETWSRGREIVGGVMQYTENGNGSVQLTGKHTFESLNDTVLDWTASFNVAESSEPDRRSIKGGYDFNRTILYDETHTMTSSNQTSLFSLSDFQRRWQDTREAGPQVQANIKLPFTVHDWQGYVKSGVFGDYIDRTYRSRVYALSDYPLIPADDEYDYSHYGLMDNILLGNPLPGVEYDGRQEIEAWYVMTRLPLPEWVDLVTGARLERTLLTTELWDVEQDLIWLYLVGTDPGNSYTYGRVYFESNRDPAEGAVNLQEQHLLPVVSLTVKPQDQFSLRLSYGETIARPTFKELTPVLYQEFDSSRIFLGNPNLEISTLKNYDLRLEWRPDARGDLLAASYFFKSIVGPIQYTSFKSTTGGSEDYIVPENYEAGTVSGFEFEVRKEMAFIWSGLEGLVCGANATLQTSSVEYTDHLRQALAQGGSPETSRPMDGQPDILVNLNLVYEYAPLGVSLGLFYNLKGEVYVAGESWSPQNGYVPNQVELPVNTLDASFGLKFAKIWRLGIEAKNILDPKIETIYRGPMGDLPNSSYRQGRTYSMSLGCTF